MPNQRHNGRCETAHLPALVEFSVVKGTTNITGNGGAFIRNVFCQDAVVPSSNATLLDNEGVAPIPAPAMETICK